uniref:Uncharacterized protein n=1 Tax=Anguilla anguilla TaxID=7936 RepID=A0A0E9XVY4_ANGAN
MDLFHKMAPRIVFNTNICKNCTMLQKNPILWVTHTKFTGSEI